VPAEKAELYNRKSCPISLFPTGDDLVLVFASYPIEEFPSNRVRLEGKFFQLLKQVPDLLEHVSSGKSDERFSGSTDLRGFFSNRMDPVGYWQEMLVITSIRSPHRESLMGSVTRTISRSPWMQALQER
jgi:hypothetical protein